MASASGLEKLLFNERNPLYTSSFGTGELIKDAIDKGAEKILLAIGGSATNDGGIGMAAALGYYFLDEHGSELSPIGNHLAQIAKIDGSRCPYRVALQTKKISVEVLCDVNNPLYGERGAAHVYAPQKGATQAIVLTLDDGLRHYARLVQQQFQIDISPIPGAGAAGGLGAGAVTFLNAILRPGIEVMMDYVKLEEQLSTCHLLITGEGRIDAQSLQGKLIKGLTSKAQHFKVPVVALCGALQATPTQIQDLGLQAAFSILNAPIQLEDALSKTADLLTETAFHVGRLLISK
ncbi:MAG: glycerate kinase [Saprospiraceae bacterium]|nr:glycerate kinase [Saprospiraceae bacterium]